MAQGIAHVAEAAVGVSSASSPSASGGGQQRRGARGAQQNGKAKRS